jgi:hypothetical protein
MDSTRTFIPNLDAPDLNSAALGSQDGSERFFSGTEEPLLEEVLADPLIHLLMERDGVGMMTLILLIRATQLRLQ